MVAATQTPCFTGLAESTVNILKLAKALLVEKENLPPKEYKQLLKEHGWDRQESSLYLRVGRAFAGFAPEDLACVEPHTIFLLARNSRKYAPAIKKLRNTAVITQEFVRSLIKGYRKPRRSDSDPSNIWRMGADALPVCRIPDIAEGDFQTGSIVEKAIKQLGLAAVQVVRNSVEFWATQNGLLPLHPEDYSTPKQLAQSTEDDSTLVSPPVTQEASEVENTTVVEKIEASTTGEEVQENLPAPTPDNLDTSEHIENPSDDMTVVANQTSSFIEAMQGKIEEVVKEISSPTNWQTVINATCNCLKDVKEAVWERLDSDQRAHLHQLKKEYIALFQIGDRVTWPNCPPHVGGWAPYILVGIDGDMGKLDIYQNPVPLAELIRLDGDSQGIVT